jgi:hypothetical protein
MSRSSESMSFAAMANRVPRPGARPVRRRPPVCGRSLRTVWRGRHEIRRPGPTFSLAARHNQCRTDFGVPIRMSVGGKAVGPPWRARRSHICRVLASSYRGSGRVPKDAFQGDWEHWGAAAGTQRPFISRRTPSCERLPLTTLSGLPPPTQEPSLGHGVAMPMGHPPLAGLAPVHLRGAQRVGARLTVDGGRRVFKAGGVGHVAHHVIRMQFERVRRAGGEAPRRMVR